MLFYDAPDPAPNPRRVRLFAAVKGINLPTRSLSIVGGEHKAPEFTAKYPPGQLPVLELDDGTILGESIAICRYLEALNPDPPLFGLTPIEVGRIDMAIRRVEFTLMIPIGMVWMHTHPFTARVVKPQYTDFGESNRPKAEAAMRQIDRMLADNSDKGEPWLAGPAFSMADIVLVTTLDFAAFIGLAEPADTPALKAWRERVEQRLA